MKVTLLSVAIAAVVLLIGGCVWDVASGHNEAKNTHVSGKEYRPAWTEIQSTYIAGTKDMPGHTELYTVYHPEEYVVFTATGERVEVRSVDWHRLEKGAPVTITHRVGGLSGMGYPWSLTERAEVEQ